MNLLMALIFIFVATPIAILESYQNAKNKQAGDDNHFDGPHEDTVV